MAVVAIFITLNAHYSVATAHIVTKFGKETENGIPKTVLPSDYSSDKIQDGGGLHIEFQKTLI